MLRPSSLVTKKRRPPGKNSAQSSVDVGAAAANVTETDEEKIVDQASRAPPCGTRSRILVLGLRCDAGNDGLRGAPQSLGTKPCLPLMCLGPLGIGRPTAGSPRRGCSHWAPHQNATSCMEPCRCHCPWPSSTDCTFCRRHCVYLAGGARHDGLREYKLSLTWTKRCLTTLGLFLPQEQRAASEGALREGGRGPGAKHN